MKSNHVFIAMINLILLIVAGVKNPLDVYLPQILNVQYAENIFAMNVGILEMYVHIQEMDIVRIALRIIQMFQNFE